MANVSTIGVKAAEVGASDGPTSSPHASRSPVLHVSHSPVECNQTRSPSPFRHSQSSRSSSSSSGSSSRSGSASGSSSLGSSWSGSSDESCMASPAGSHAGSQVPSEGSSSSGSVHSQSTSPEAVLVQGDDEDTAAGGEDAGHSEDEEALSQGTVSLLNILTSNNKEACKAAVHETVRKRTFSMVPGRMNKSTRGMKALPNTTSRSMTTLMVVNLARLWTRLAPLFPTWKSKGCSNPWTP